MDLSPWYRVYTKEIFISKGSYEYRETRNVCPYSVQKTLLPVRAVKLPRLNAVDIGPRTEACINWGGPIAMVPCLHQGIIYFKRMIRVWSDQKCMRLVGARIPLTCADRKQSHLKGGGMGSRWETCVNWGGPIVMVPCLHQGNIYTKRKLRVWRDQKCVPLLGRKTAPTCAGRQTRRSQGSQH